MSCSVSNAAAAAKQKANVDPDRIVEMLLQRFDKNKDGMISKAEAHGKLAQHFDQLDKNKDGYLDKTELKAAARLFAKAVAKGKEKAGPATQGLPDFNTLDKNADGRLSRDEVKGTVLEKQFNEIDTNKDGLIDPQEYKAYRDKVATRQ
jgi:Ca2+-binding EF-hand superfamily protein